MESALCFSLLILLSSLSLLSSQYVFPDHYFINCGSNAAVSFTGKSFIGDGNSDSISVSGGRAAAQNNNRNPTSIYETARVFTEKSWYELQADETNTFLMVRLHFSPISSNEFDFSASKFNVSVYGFSVLTNFSVGNATVMEEFVIPIGSEKSFRIEFTPSQSSSMAFVNAIEAFTTPSDLFKDEIYNFTSPLIPIHRINVGGQTITVADDTLRRNWVPDDSFILNSESAKNATYDGQIMYQASFSSQFDAPDNVYNTAKQLNTNSTSITWNFEVNKNTSFLVRAHFCDIITTGFRSPNDSFDFFINNKKILMISPLRTVQQLAAPFYLNFMEDSSDLGFINISIRPIENNQQTPFLNGLEIMKILQESRRVDPVKENKKKKSVLIIVGCVIGGVAFLLALLLGYFIGTKYQKVKPAVSAKSDSHVIPSYGGDSYTSVNTNSPVNHPSPIPNLNLGLRVPFSDILIATKNFDSNLMIGQGGFGKVYKGTFPNGTKVAVKRGEKGHGQGRPEFVTEILVLSKIRHRHLVSLIGYCDERSEMILVYEFMEKGTLQDHLYNSKMDHSMLTWKQRLDICISAAQGLHYLHTGSDGGIIHRDVKSTNILLNEHYVAKVADFGISRLDNVDESEFSEVKGSFGYLDPEYIRCMKLTQKSDVYSFGVVLLEVLCARPALDNSLPHKEANLADWAIRQIKNGEVEKIIDPFIVGTINPNSLRKFLDTAERCLKDTGDERPSMIDVLWDLEYASQLQQTTTIREPHEDSTMNTSLQLPMSVLHRLPSNGIDDDSEVNHSSVSSHVSESQVFSQLKIDEAR